MHEVDWHVDHLACRLISDYDRMTVVLTVSRFVQRLLEEQQAREAKDRTRKRLRQRPGSVASAVADAMAQLRAESVGHAEMLSSLDRIQAVLEGRPDTVPAKEQRNDNGTANSDLQLRPVSGCDSSRTHACWPV